jgi:hypothetical protein
MYNLDDKELDRLSKAAADNYEAPGMASWEAMERTLNVELPQEEKKKRRGFFFFFLFAGCLAGIAIWYGIQRNNTSTNNKIAIQSGLPTGTEKHVANPESATTITENHSGESVNPKNQTNNPDLSPKTTGNEISSSVPGISGNSTVPANASNQSIKSTAPPLPIKEIARTENKKVKAEAQAIIPLKEKPVRKAAGDNKPVDQPKNSIAVQHAQKITGLPLASLHARKQKREKQQAERIGRKKDFVSKTKQQIKSNTETDKVEDASTANAEVQAGKADENTTGQQSVVKDSSITVLDSGITSVKVVKKQLPKQAAIADTTKSTVIKKKDAHKEKAIIAGLIGGFDYSTVKFTYGDKTGYNIGAIAGYQFNKHWSVITGAIYTRKNYHLKGSDYHPPKHSMASYLNIQSVQGYCNMWEVPLLARYTFNQGRTNSYFISSGISSYFMKQQKYTYDYITNAVSYDTSAAYNNTYNHVFSILHLSAGIEKKLGKHTGLLIEPYAKIPLGGVGYGNIRLSSFGINFSIQLRQPLKH